MTSNAHAGRRVLGSLRSADGKGVVRNAVLLLHGTTGSGKGFLAANFAGEPACLGELTGPLLLSTSRAAAGRRS